MSPQEEEATPMTNEDVEDPKYDNGGEQEQPRYKIPDGSSNGGFTFLGVVFALIGCFIWAIIMTAKYADEKNSNRASANQASASSADASPQDPTSSPTPQVATPNVEETEPFLGVDNSQRLLLREGIISEIPADLCGNTNSSKNVILVIGDGMGWEMVRAGAIAKRVIEEVEGLGCDTKVGCPNTTQGDAVLAAFQGRTLSDFYTEGKGAGLSFQTLPNFDLVTTTTTVIGEPNAGNHYGPRTSMLGPVTTHKRGMADLLRDDQGNALEFDPRDFELEGGNMVLWNDTLGGTFPWDPCYYSETMEGCDVEYILQHATDSASTAGSLATGVKSAASMLSVDLYERSAPTLIEEAMYCGKAGGAISSVPIFHATPAAQFLHANYRSDRDALRRGYLEVKPTAAVGVCAGRYYPLNETTLESMRNGALSSEFTLFEQKPGVLAANFWDGIDSLDPDNGHKIFGCMGGDFARASESNMPYRGLDSTYSQRHCSSGDVNTDVDGNPTAVLPTTPDTLCDHYGAEDVAEIPTMAVNVKETLEFLAKDDDGFFMMYEQGDIDWAAHSNHMDDMLGTMLDISDSVNEIMEWINANGGYEKNALYVTADHDHYLTLTDKFPERLATLLVMGASHLITPQNNSAKNPWSEAIKASRHEDDSKSQTEHISDFTTWTDQDIQEVAHFWGPRGSGGNGWGSHTTRPVPLHYGGDDGCVEALKGKNFRVLGKEVKGFPDKIDQVHLHACMLKNLFGM